MRIQKALSIHHLTAPLAIAMLAAIPIAPALQAQGVDPHEPGILEPVSSALQDKEIRIPNTDQSVDGIEQSNVEGEIERLDALTTTSSLGHPITHVASPNEDMRLALLDMAAAAAARDQAAMEAAATELRNILFGITQGRIYDGFPMLNFNRWTYPGLDQPQFHQPGIIEDEYKMKVARDTGRTYISPFDGAERKIWEVDVSMLYYDGQIDADTFLLKFPYGHDPDDVLHVNYSIYSLVQEDFSPTLVMLDRREAQDTVSFPFKGFDSVWIAFDPGEVLKVTLRYPPIRMVRGVYTWGWRVHPPRIQFLQPIYEIKNKHTDEIELDPQGISFAVRNRDNLTLDNIGDAAPEKKMYELTKAILLDGVDPATIEMWMTDPDKGPKGTWIEWADLATDQLQLPPEAWDKVEEEDGLSRGQFGDYKMISVFLNNEMYGEGPFLNEIETWLQGDEFKIKLLNLDNHTHYFRNVDFSDRLHDDILRCCGGGLTSFEIMNFKPSYGAPKVAEMQWRAGWGFRPHHDVIQQQNVFPRGRDGIKLQPYMSGLGKFYFGYQYSEEARGGDFRFNPPDFIITDHDNPAPFSLHDKDKQPGLVLGQRTEGYGIAQMCPDDPAGDFCQTDFGPYNPNGKLNWPSPNDPQVPKTELRFPAFLRNPAQGDPVAGDIIPPTDVWRPFLWINPYNGSLYIDPEDPSQGYWADLTYSHGAPVYADASLNATVELPRSSGQVFYQFDDLFHDNSIFSPHPLSVIGSNDETDSVERLRARKSGQVLEVRGLLEEFSVTLEYADWISLFDGIAGDFGCTGERIAVRRVNDEGWFKVRLFNNDVPSGATVCVESTQGGYADTVVE